MFSNALIVFFAASMAVAAPLRSFAPRGYAQDAELLQPYADYNNRYVALGCVDKHNTTFFDQCCHPLLKDEPLSALPSQCTPAPSATSSAAASGETVAPTGDDGDDGDCGDDESSSVAPTTSIAAPASTVVPTTSAVPTTVAVPGNVEHSHSAAPTTSAAPTSSPAPASSDVPTTSAKPTSVKATPTPKPSTTSSKAPAPTTAASNTGNSANTGGVATFFFQGGNPGACGDYHSDSDLIVAIDQDRYGDSSVKSPLCGKQVKITNTNNGKSVTATIADDCPSCINRNSIDLSVGTFTQIATEDEGEVPISWVFV